MRVGTLIIRRQLQCFQDRGGLRPIAEQSLRTFSASGHGRENCCLETVVLMRPGQGGESVITCHTLVRLAASMRHGRSHHLPTWRRIHSPMQLPRVVIQRCLEQTRWSPYRS